MPTQRDHTFTPPLSTQSRQGQPNKVPRGVATQRVQEQNRECAGLLPGRSFAVRPSDAREQKPVKDPARHARQFDFEMGKQPTPEGCRPGACGLPSLTFTCGGKPLLRL